MTPRALILHFARQFESAGVPDPALDASLLLAHVTGREAFSLRLDDWHEVDAADAAACAALCQRRMAREPLQYITGEQYFCGRRFAVDSRVLIPRPETELLAERAVAALRKFSPEARLLDLCCGSGAIGVTAALDVRNARVWLADLSPDALAAAERNAVALDASVTLRQGDLFAAVAGEQFHVVVSNPPYISTVDCKTLQEEVRREPLLALDGGADGLDFYRRISREASEHLLPGGVLLLEVGAGQAEVVAALLEGAGLTDLAIHEDYQHIARMVEGRRDV